MSESFIEPTEPTNGDAVNPVATNDETSGSSQAPSGVIIPPPDTRDVIEKTVEYVARRGQAFVSRIRDSERNNPKFSFIHEDDPYHPYYEWRLAEHKAGNASSSGFNNDGGMGSSTAGSSVSSLPQEPPAFEFSAQLPPISPQDLEIIKLTARYAARSGHQFITALAHREKSNFQYEFLKPTHSLYLLFNNLVNQYKKVINPTNDIKDKVEQGASNKYLVLAQAKTRAEWIAYKEERDKRIIQEAEAEKIAYAQIDWHDFVVVETIEFTQADLDMELPPPISLSQIQFASLEQKRAGTYRIEEAPPDYEPEVAAPRKITIPQAPASFSSSSRSKKSEPSKPSLPPKPAMPISNNNTAQVPIPGLFSAPPTDETMKIRSAGSSRRNKLMTSKENTILSPYTGEAIPESQYNEHMKIMSLDPKWKEQRAVEEARQSTTNLSTNEVDINLKRLASSRSDLFDSDNTPTSEEERERIKRAAREVQWDGRESSRAAAIFQAQSNRNVDEKDRQKHLAKQNRIGPRKQT